MIMLDGGSSHRPELETVAASAGGTIERCRCCGVVHVRFGNALLRVQLDGLIQLHHVVRSRCTWLAVERWHGLVDVDAAAFSEDIQIGESGVGFTFSAAELYALDALIRQAMPRLIGGVTSRSSDVS